MSEHQLFDFDWQSLIEPIKTMTLGIIKDKAKIVTGELVSKSVDQARKQWEKIDFRGKRNDYKSNLLSVLSTTKVLGNQKTIQVEDIYTDAYVFDRISALLRFSADINIMGSNDEQSIPDRSRLSALEVAKEGDNLFILGRPGAGKTTFLKYLAILACKGQFNKTPIFVSLKDWSDSSLSLLPFIAQQFDICGFPDSEIFVKALLENGGAIVLLDGLDEVNELQNKRSQTIKEIVNLSHKFRKCQYCLTCRTAATDYSFEKFKYLEIADFDEDQQIRFVTQWYGEDSKHLARFLEGWRQKEHGRLRELGKTPLLLTLLCLAFDETLSFPLRQVDLYKEAIDALLRKWDTSRLISRDDFYKNLSFSRREHLLESVASKFYFESKTIFRKNELERAILAFLHSLPDREKSEDADAATVVKQIEAQHGLIVERASGIYSFSHLTFQEYFTAAYLVKLQSDKQLDRVVEIAMRDQKWREVMLYTVALLPSADSVLSKMAQRLKEMRGSDPGVVRFLGYCLCQAHLNGKRRGTPEAKIGTRYVSDIKSQIESYITSTRTPPLTTAETEAIAEHFVRIRGFLRAREKKFEFGMAAPMVAAAADLITKQPSRAATILGGYFTRPEEFIAYLYACRLMIECLEVAVATQRHSYIESVMSISEIDINRALASR